MRKFIKKIVVAILQLEAKLVLWRYKPKIIAVTGSVGKTSTKDAIFTVVDSVQSARKSQKSYNSELGVPLTILGQENAWYSPVGWLKIIFAGTSLFLRRSEYPEVLVIEMGADKPRDIKRSVMNFPPHIGVITAIGEVPVHVEFFAGPEAVAREKVHVVRALGDDCYAILNFDDVAVLDMREKTKAKVLTFGFGDGADIQASHYSIMYRNERGASVPEGITFKVDHQGSSVPIRLFNTFGKHHVYAALAAIAVGVSQNINLVDIGSALSEYSAPPGRLKLIEGEKDTWILDDSYNSSPMALHAAIDLLEELPVPEFPDGTRGRKIAVLGDMLELGKFAIEAHRAAGSRLDKIDMLFTVGPRSKFIAEEVRSNAFAKEGIFEYSDSRDAARDLEQKIRPGDIILIKGSQAMRMERIVEEIMARPDKKEELLVRQDPVWLAKP